MNERVVRVLVVDDDEDDYIIARDLLGDTGSGSGFETDWVASYGAALAMIVRDEHDVYLVDYHLGGANGLDLIRKPRRGEAPAARVSVCVPPSTSWRLAGAGSG